jgi:hypothetical protein
VPFLSKAQQRFAYANPEKFGGKGKLAEWSAATNFGSLPEKKKPSRMAEAFKKAKK